MVRGQLPPAVDDLIAALDADDEDDIVSIFESMARIAGDADDLEARDLVTAAVSRSMAKHPRFVRRSTRRDHRFRRRDSHLPGYPAWYGSHSPTSTSKPWHRNGSGVSVPSTRRSPTRRRAHEPDRCSGMIKRFRVAHRRRPPRPGGLTRAGARDSSAPTVPANPPRFARFGLYHADAGSITVLGADPPARHRPSTAGSPRRR